MSKIEHWINQPFPYSSLFSQLSVRYRMRMSSFGKGAYEEAELASFLNVDKSSILKENKNCII